MLITPDCRDFCNIAHKRFPTAVVNYLCADREFVGQAWMRYLLLEPSLAFRLRIRSSDLIERDGKTLAARIVFAHVQIGQSQHLTHGSPIFERGGQIGLESMDEAACSYYHRTS